MQSLPVAQVEGRRGGPPLCIVPSLPVRMGTVSPYRSTDVFVLDVDKFMVRTAFSANIFPRLRSHVCIGGGLLQST